MPTVSFTDEELRALAERLAPFVVAQVGTHASPWLSAVEAAAYLRCPVSRIRKLTTCGDLPVRRDGRRVLYRREELDAFVEAGGAVSP